MSKKTRYYTDPIYREAMKKLAREKYHALMQNKEWKMKQQGRGKQRYKDSTEKQRFRLLIKSAKHNLRKFDKITPFTITADDFEIPKLCPVLGIPIFFGGQSFSPNLPSLDRLVPRFGYVKDNVRIISWRANRLKADCTNPAELRAIAEYMEANLVDAY